MTERERERERESEKEREREGGKMERDTAYEYDIVCDYDIRIYFMVHKINDSLV